MDPSLEDMLVERLAAYAAAQIGFSPEAIRTDAIRRMLRKQLRESGRSLDELVQSLEQKDGALFAALRQAVLVHETYFFRQVEHFDFLTSTALPALLQQGLDKVRALSAGCSTGEEVYSLAACFRAMNVPGQSEVVGTDISAASLQSARAGIYTRWSSRESAPPLFPVHAPLGKDRLKVLDEVAAITRFAEHNLLEPLRQHLGEFQIIFCRNVLAYFSAPAGRIAVANLMDALAPGGYAFFGAMDVDRTPIGLEEVPSRGLQIFRKPAPGDRAKPAPADKAKPQPLGERKRKSGSRKEAPSAEAAPDEAEEPRAKDPKEQVKGWVEAHVHALAHIEHGQRLQAEKELSDLRRRAPSYLPGLLELALLDLRNGRRGSAEELMREILRRSEERPQDEDCEGPEVLPVSYYRTAARALLSGPGGGGEG